MAPKVASTDTVRVDLSGGKSTDFSQRCTLANKGKRILFTSGIEVQAFLSDLFWHCVIWKLYYCHRAGAEIPAFTLGPRGSLEAHLALLRPTWLSWGPRGSLETHMALLRPTWPSWDHLALLRPMWLSWGPRGSLETHLALSDATSALLWGTSL